MQSKQSREEDVADAARLELFQVLMSFSVGRIRGAGLGSACTHGTATSCKQGERGRKSGLYFFFTV